MSLRPGVKLTKGAITSALEQSQVPAGLLPHLALPVHKFAHKAVSLMYPVRVLIVDDDQAIRQTVIDALTA